MNNHNLIPFDKMSPEQHRELSARGGRASGETKRRKIKMREQLVSLMEYNAARDGLEDDLLEAVKEIRKRERRRQKDRKFKQRQRENSRE